MADQSTTVTLAIRPEVAEWIASDVPGTSIEAKISDVIEKAYGDAIEFADYQDHLKKSGQGEWADDIEF